jgi:hypothetical protein
LHYELLEHSETHTGRIRTHRRQLCSEPYDPQKAALQGSFSGGTRTA